MLPLQSFNDYIRQYSLFSSGDQILLAVSGGRDSVLMAHLFKKAGYHFAIAHCNFGLRAGESQRDEHFVRTLASVLEVPFFRTKFDTKLYAREHKISTQMAARELRYAWFEEIRVVQGFDWLAVAHHQDDAIETVLLNLVRGTGIAGLHGILPKRDFLIRPLLFLSRKEIDETVAVHHLEFVEDSSNLSSTYARNKIRLDVIPRLKEINPNLEDTFERNIRRFADTELVLQQVVSQLKRDLFEERNHHMYVAIDKVRALQPQRLLLFELLKKFHFTEAVCLELAQSLHKQSGTSFYSVSHRITINRNELVISRVSTGQEQQVMLHSTDHRIQTGDQWLEVSYADDLAYEKNRFKAYVDLDKLIFPLVVRTWQDGDRFMPLGMKQYKNISDFFVDLKIPLPEKQLVPILVNGNGEIVWVIGLRQDNRYKVTTTTKKVAIFEQKFI